MSALFNHLRPGSPGSLADLGEAFLPGYGYFEPPASPGMPFVPGGSGGRRPAAGVGSARMGRAPRSRAARPGGEEVVPGTDGFRYPINFLHFRIFFSILVYIVMNVLVYLFYYCVHCHACSSVHCHASFSVLLLCIVNSGSSLLFCAFVAPEVVLWSRF